MRWINKQVLSFGHAIRGLRRALTEAHFQFHLMALFIVSLMGFYFQLTKMEWIAIIVVSSIVLSAEVMNTAVEVLCDRVTKEYDPDIGLAKDLAAASVLLSAIGATITGVIIFIPKCWNLIQSFY